MTATPSSSAATPFLLRGEHITLDALLKATGLVGSGGHAKLLITSGDVLVDGSAASGKVSSSGCGWFTISTAISIAVLMSAPVEARLPAGARLMNS